MTATVIWHRIAEEDLTEIFLHIGADSPDTADRWLDAVEAAVEFLRESPGAGRLVNLSSPRTRHVRSWVVGGFRSYLIFYRTGADELAVLRILHGARDLLSLLEAES